MNNKMNNAVCYPASHIPFYVMAIVFITIIFVIIFWQSNKQSKYEFYYNMHHSYPGMISNANQMLPNTMTIGNHNSAHGSPIIAAPYVAPKTNFVPYKT